MSAGGEAQNTDAVRIDVEIGAVRADDGKGSLRVLKGDVGPGVGSGIGDAVLEQKTGDVSGVEPLADLRAFEIDCENAVAATGEDDDGSAGRVQYGLVDGESGGGDVAQANDGAAGDETVSERRGVSFRGSGRKAVRWSGGPDCDDRARRAGRPGEVLRGEKGGG